MEWMKSICSGGVEAQQVPHGVDEKHL